MYGNTATQTINTSDFDAMIREMEQDFALHGNPWPEFEPTEEDFEAMMRENEAYRTHSIPAA